jgi:hypothetical protein
LWTVLNSGRSVLVHTPIHVASRWFRLFLVLLLSLYEEELPYFHGEIPVETSDGLEAR